MWRLCIITCDQAFKGNQCMIPSPRQIISSQDENKEGALSLGSAKCSVICHVPHPIEVAVFPNRDKDLNE